uniref:Uncharacterized protein n=1 Tax=Tetraselmis sp. GSL018 TaxID=582737 RepID=A0A061SH17_9CHLO
MFQVFLAQDTVEPLGDFLGSEVSNMVFIEWRPGPEYIEQCPGYTVTLDVTVTLDGFTPVECDSISARLEDALRLYIQEEAGDLDPDIQATCPEGAGPAQQYTLRVTISLKQFEFSDAELLDLVLERPDAGEKIREALGGSVASVSVEVVGKQIISPPAPPSPPSPPAVPSPPATPAPTESSPEPATPAPSPPPTVLTAPPPSPSPGAPPPEPVPPPPAPPTATQEPLGEDVDDGDGGSNLAIIIGAAVGGVVAILVLAAVAFYVVQRRGQQVTAVSRSEGGNDQPLLSQAQGEATEGTDTPAGS